MKKNHSPGGAGIGLRVLFYSFAFIAVIGTRETLSDGNGPVSTALGRTFNQLLKGSSKLGLGFAIMNSDDKGESTLVGRYSRSLGIAAHKAYVSSAKVELFAR